MDQPPIRVIAGHQEVYRNPYHNFRFGLRPLARQPLILKTRRDFRLVEGARLESEAGERHPPTLKRVNVYAISDLTPPKQSLRVRP